MSSLSSTETTQTAIRQYNELIQEQQQLAQKISEFEMDRHEHQLVEETLTPLDPSRRAYRLVGEVLVERTVEEVLPSVKKNLDNIDTTIMMMKKKLQESAKEAAEVKTKYNLQTEPAR
ncbi:hypothetical protein MPSEU_000073300 [Mayamaea pseudoterrestris]|nr:hypothetical protein MPSEU_000073300 [Mayamaea pseudoterrestris]